MIALQPLASSVSCGCSNEGSPGLAHGVVSRNVVSVALPEGVAAGTVLVQIARRFSLQQQEPTGLRGHHSTTDLISVPPSL